MLWRRILILMATLVALFLAVNCAQRSRTNAELITLVCYQNDIEDVMFRESPLYRFMLQDKGLAASCYPYVWQKKPRERLREILTPPQQVPTGTDELALARFAQYAMKHANEKICREGLLREPDNALYHYLLADWYLQQSLHGKGPKFDKKTGTLKYDYTVIDRRKLDLGMRELATATQLPYQNHRATLLKAKLAALPPVRGYIDIENKNIILGAVLFPEYAKFRNFARVNGYYLSLLLAEKRRAEAEPFLHSMERLEVHISNDTTRSFIGQLVAIAISTISKRNDAYVCRQFGYSREAAMIESRQQILMGKLVEWKNHGRLNDKKKMDKLINEHAGLLSKILLPIYGKQPPGVITIESLRPGRMLEYVLLERCIATGLSLFSFLLLLYAALKYWRWQRVTHGAASPATAMTLTSRDWLSIICCGLLLPLALYVLFINIPALSRRDYGFSSNHWAFFLGVAAFALWIIIVPTSMASGMLLRKSIAAGLLTNDHPWRTRITRFISAKLTVIWCLLSFLFLLLPISWALLAPLRVNSPFRGDSTMMAQMCVWLVLMLLIPLLPLFWTRKHADRAPYHLAMSHTMMTTYAMMTLFFASLVPVYAAFEHHYVQIDQVQKPMQQGDELCMNMVEGQLVGRLRNDVREGADKLGIPWK